MRQVFRQLPWIHPQIDPRIQQFFNQYGRYLRLKQGASIFNGGDTGEIALVLSGLGVFSFPDKHLKNHYLSLIPPGSLMGDVDGLTHESVNVYDSAFRDSEVRLIKRDIFRDFLIQNPELLQDVSEALGIARGTLDRDVHILKEMKLLSREGGRLTGTWRVSG